MTVSRRQATLALAALGAAPGLHAQPAAPSSGGGPKVLRVSFPTAETGFDPARVYDLYSRTVTAHLFEGLYRYDHLARPYRIRPCTAVGMPETSEDFRETIVRLQPGIYFQDDPAFDGKRRELVAADYVYAIKRFLDPANKSPAVSEVLEMGFVGLNALRDRAIADRTPFDYDQPVEGLQALDRYTLRFRTELPRPRLIELLATGSGYGGVAREVVEKYGDDIMAHPVGTGPFRLAQWRRSSRIVLERNPTYREVRYDEQPAPDDAPGQAILAQLKGRRLPMVDRVEISIIEELQPNWLAFLNGELDHVSVPGDFVSQAVPGGQLAPNLARQGMTFTKSLNADSIYAYFNMADPVIGGYTPEKVALRRAISLAIDTERIIRLLYRGQGIPAQSPLTPHASGYDPHFKSEMGDHDPLRAQALLDLFGYTDRDGDGWRELPDGTPLRLVKGTSPDQFSRGIDELLKKDLAAVGIQLDFVSAQWSEQLKAARAGKLQMWMLGGSATVPDGAGSLARYQSEQVGAQNFAQFKSEAFDRLYAELQRLPDGEARNALFRQCQLIGIAYMPYKSMLHRISTDLCYGHLIGHRRPLFWRAWFHMVDIVQPGMNATA